MKIKELHKLFLKAKQKIFKDVNRAEKGSIFIGLHNDKFTNKGQGNHFARTRAVPL